MAVVRSQSPFLPFLHLVQPEAEPHHAAPARVQEEHPARDQSANLNPANQSNITLPPPKLEEGVIASLT